MTTSGTVRVALAGNPNSGKTTLFNALTGSRQKVANYPGVTVEKREGHYTHEGTSYDVLDLPGTYSLTSYSPEERVAQRELTETRPDVTVVVVDSTNLKRNLVLFAQVAQLGANPILCLNMWDEAEEAGQQLALEQMRSLLGVPVIPTAAVRGQGVQQLKQAIATAVQEPIDARRRVVLGERLQTALDAVERVLLDTDIEPLTHTWVAHKLIVGDAYYEARLALCGEVGEEAIQLARDLRAQLEDATRMDVALFVAEQFYGFVHGLLEEVVTQPSRADARALSDAIDRVLVHRFLGVPIFLGIMYLLFWLTFSVGDYPMQWLEAGFEHLGELVANAWDEGTASPLRSLIVDGIIGGVGGVVVFLPNILLLFLGLAFLEDTGYMARAAFLMDRLLHRFGLHGQSFIPMVTGFGCSIPGIMATRALANERDRIATILVLPLMSCGARLPIWMLLIPAFFPAAWHAPVLWGIYMLGILLALTLALILRKSVLRGDEAPFVMELPPYRMPTVAAAGRAMLDRSWTYLRKAGTVILGISIVLWALTAYPKPESYEIDRKIADGSVKVVAADAPPADAEGAERISEATVERMRGRERLLHSAVGHIGSWLEPAIAPMGFDWRIGTALIGAFAAKEVFVAQMGIVYSLEEGGEGADSLRRALSRDYSPLVGISLIIFLLVATPCMATVAIVRKETGSWRWALFQFLGLTTLGYLLSTLAFQIGRLVG